MSSPKVSFNVLFQVIAGLYTNASMVLELLENTRFPESNESITLQFFKQWIKDAELFVG